jgi:hypothetical protein
MANKQSYKEKQELMKMSQLAAGLVSERYSGVSSIVFHLTYYQSALNRVLMTRTLNFFPANYAYFHMECKREECIDGGFDLAPVVADMVKKHKNSTKGKIFCHGKNSSLGNGNGDAAHHASIAYEINIKYKQR